MKNAGIFMLTAALFAVCTLKTDAFAKGEENTEIRLAIIHTNDIHGQAAGQNADSESPAAFGYAALAEVRKELLEDGYEVLLLDAGDASRGSQLVNYFQGASAFEFMNAVAYDAMAPGSHEFDWGTQNFLKNVSTADFPVLAANLCSESTGEPVAGTNTVIETESGVRVGIFGLVSPKLKKLTNPKNTAGLTVSAGGELYECAQEQVDLLREEDCDLIICIGHLGDGPELEPNRTSDVLENTEGIDLWIDGDEYSASGDMIHNTLVVCAEEGFAQIGIVRMEDGMLSEEIRKADEYDFKKRDMDVTALVAEKEAWLRDEMESVIGSSEVDLNGEREDVLTKETNLGDLAADAMLWQACQSFGPDIAGAIGRGGTIEASLKKGDFSRAALEKIHPGDECIAVLTVSGQTLLEALEAACSKLPEESEAFPQVSGITFSVDISVPAGKRVSIQSVGGDPFAPEAAYRIAVSDAMLMGDGAYEMFVGPYMESGATTGVSIFDALTGFVTEKLDGLIGEDYKTRAGRIEINGGAA